MHKAANMNPKYREATKLQSPSHLPKQCHQLGLKCSNARVNDSHFSFNPPDEIKNILSLHLSPSLSLSVSLCCVCNCVHAYCAESKRGYCMCCSITLRIASLRKFLTKPGDRLVNRKLHQCSCPGPYKRRVTGVHDNTKLLQWILGI